MRLAAGAQGGIALSPMIVDLGGDAGPVKDGEAQVRIAGEAAVDEGELAALAGDGSDTGEGAQGVAIMAGDRLGGFREQGGEQAIAGGGGRVDDGDVVEGGLGGGRLLGDRRDGGLGELGDEGVALPADALELAIEELQAGDEAAAAVDGSFGGAGGDGEGGPAQDGLGSSGVQRRTPWRWKKRARVLTRSLAASAGVGASSQKARNQSAASSSHRSRACL